MKSVLDYLKQNQFRGMLITSGFILAVLVAGILLATADKQPEVRHVASVEHPGYQSSPEYYLVEASPAKKWADTPKSLVILGFIVAAMSGLAIYYSEYSPEEAHSSRTGYMLVLAWLVALSLVFGPYTLKHGDSSYQTKLCVDAYQQNAGHLDALFPDTDTEFNCD